MKILLAGDQPLFLEGLQNLLATRGYEVVITAGNGREALAKALKSLRATELFDLLAILEWGATG